MVTKSTNSPTQTVKAMAKLKRARSQIIKISFITLDKKLIAKSFYCLQGSKVANFAPLKLTNLYRLTSFLMRVNPHRKITR